MFWLIVLKFIGGDKKMNQIITDEIIREAKNTPNGWVYKIDSNYDLTGDIRPEAIVGAWEVDGNGNITGDFISNKNYSPCS
jgi:hypothetical protein